jgi:hypothetical protein
MTYGSEDPSRHRQEDLWRGSNIDLSGGSPAEASHSGLAGAVGPVGPAFPRRGKFHGTGTVANFKQRTEAHRRVPTAQIVNFRLERYDDRGNRLPPVPVEMRGITLAGHIGEGELIEISGRFFDGILFAKHARNLTTGGGLSTRATSRVGRFLGRRTEWAVVGLVLVTLACCVRFIPQVYFNTPFGLHEYRSEVAATCERLNQIGQGGDVSVNADGLIDRRILITAYDANVTETEKEYSLLLSHVTPIISRSRRDRVAHLMPELRAYFANARQLLLTLPAEMTFTQLEKAGDRTAALGASLKARLGDAMSQLAGGGCRAK